jgi:hypothetical protein
VELVPGQMWTLVGARNCGVKVPHRSLVALMPYACSSAGMAISSNMPQRVGQADSTIRQNRAETQNDPYSAAERQAVLTPSKKMPSKKITEEVVLPVRYATHRS